MKAICIQMELCGPDLRSVLNSSQNVDSKKVMGICLQLLQGIDHIHGYGLIHRDLKPENIFTCSRDPKVVKIGDLGIATSQGAAATVTRTKSAGTQLYLAPEQATSKYGKSVDIYALGIIFLELLHPTVKQAFNQNSVDKLVEMVTTLRYRQEIPKSVQEKWPIASKTIQNMTAFQVSQRPTCKEIYDLFLKSVGPMSQDSKPSGSKLQPKMNRDIVKPGDPVPHKIKDANFSKIKPSKRYLPKVWQEEAFLKLVEELKASKSEDKQEKLIELVTNKALPKNNWLDIIFKNFPDLINSKSVGDNWSFLHHAAYRNELGATRYFIERKLNVNGQSKYLYTPLHLAAFLGFVKIAKALLEAGADPNIGDECGWRPFHRAASNIHVEVGALLLSFKADPNIKTNDGKTVLDIAKKWGHAKFIEMIKSHQNKALHCTLEKS